MALTTRDIMILLYGEKELIQLTDRTIPRKEEINDSVLNRAIATASSWVKTYISESYDYVDVESDPGQALVQVESDIARYILYVRTKPSHVTDDFNAAILYLKNLKAAAAPMIPGSQGTAESRRSTRVYSPNKQFGTSTQTHFLNRKVD